MRNFDPSKIKNPVIRAQAMSLLAVMELGKHLENRQILPENQSSLIQAQSTPAASRKSSKIPNKTEALYNREWLGGRGQYEGITFRLLGGSRYTPDWYLFDAGAHSVIECKNARHKHHSHGRALTAFKEARAQYPGFIFTWMELQEDGTWVEKYNG